jgi:NitT/TauT family transport system substrate-binding protein
MKFKETGMKGSIYGLLVLVTMLSGSTAFAADVVRVGNLKFAHYGAIYYMKEIAPKYHIKIEERVFAKGIDIIPAISAGEIDVAVSAAHGAVAARASGVPVYIMAGFAKGGARIVGAPYRKWQSVADLKGKRVGVARGGAHELVLLAELGKHKLSFSDKPGKDVLIRYMSYSDLNLALLSGHVDAICQSEPQSSQAIGKGYALEIVKPYDTTLGVPVRTLIMTEKMYAKRDLAERFMKCFVEATKTFIEQPAFAERYVRDVVFDGLLKGPDYHEAIANSPFTYDVTVQHVQATSDLMVKYRIGNIPKPPPAKSYVKLDLLEKAKKALKAK